MLCHNHPGQNYSDLRYYPDNHKSMRKSLKMALQHTRITCFFGETNLSISRWS